MIDHCLGEASGRICKIIVEGDDAAEVVLLFAKLVAENIGPDMAMRIAPVFSEEKDFEADLTKFRMRGRWMPPAADGSRQFPLLRREDETALFGFGPSV